MITSNNETFKPLSSDMMGMLKQLECEEKVCRIHVKDVPIWPLMRIRWFFSEWERLYTSSSNRSESSFPLWKKLKPWFVQICDRRLFLPVKLEGHRRADILFMSNCISIVKLGNEWYEKFCDPLIDEGSKSKFKSVLWSPCDVEKSPTHTKIWSAQAPIAFITLCSAFLAKISRPRVKLLTQLMLIRKKLECNGYQATYFSPSKVLTDAYRVRMLTKFFQRRLAIVKPRIACIVSYYSLEGMSFVWACKKMGIPVVDLQHGVQGPLHPAYSQWAINQQYRSSIPLVPDFFWVWSPSEATAIEDWTNGTDHQCYVGGNPWVDLWKTPNDEPVAIKQLRKKAETVANRAHGKFIVLVTLQYGLAYSEQLEPLRGLLEFASDTCKFWIRLHPMMMDRLQEIKQYLNNPFVEIDEVSDLPLPVLLTHCDAHITHSSSTVIEASDYNVPSIITSRFGAELFKEHLNAGLAIEANADPIHIHSALKNLQQLEKNTQKDNRSNHKNECSLQGLMRVVFEATNPGAKE